MPDPALLRLLAEACDVNAAQLEDTASRITHASAGIRPIEGGLTLEHAAEDLAKLAKIVRQRGEQLRRLAVALRGGAG